MSVHDLWHTEPDPPEPAETIWVLRFSAKPGSGAGYDELKEYLEAVTLYADTVLESARFINGRDVLEIRIRSFKHNPEGFNWVFLRELDTWQELQVIESREDPPCQACT